MIRNRMTSLPKKIITYLAGPMEAVADGGAQWRVRITPKLKDIFGDRIEVQDPCKDEATKLGDLVESSFDVKDVKELIKGWRQSGCWEKVDEATDRIYRADRYAVLRSTFIILYFPVDKKMGGTISELTWAHDHNIPVYAVVEGPVSEANPWSLGLIRRGGRYYPNFTQVLESITNDYHEYVVRPPEEKK